jgi:hypothetical protein
LNIYRLLSLLSGLIASSYLMGCTTFPSENVDPIKNNKAAFQKDLAECKEDHPESSAGLHYKRWADCMNLKGWK